MNCFCVAADLVGSRFLRMHAQPHSANSKALSLPLSRTILVQFDNNPEACSVALFFSKTSYTMNGTVLTNGSDSSAGNGNNFSRASMIGMFIALQLCQLTQPYESLLFRGGGGSFWRCNPISSFTEACIIYFYLGRNVFFIWRVSGRGKVIQNLQLVAGALLLLRASNADEDAEALLDDLMTESLLEPLQDENAGTSAIPGSIIREADISDTSVVSMSTRAVPSTIS